MERLNKFLAQAGIASRRKCDRLIAEGRVKVNGVVVTNPATRVLGSDLVLVDDVPVRGTPRSVYIMFHKPREYITTLKDPYGRKTIAELVGDIPSRVFPVGRLDRESEGLLLLTNDGVLAYVFTHPRFQVERRYLVYAKGRVRKEELLRLREGVVRRGELYRINSGRILDVLWDCSLVEVTLTEGKKHEVRILFDSIVHPVVRLVRVAMGPVVLDPELPPGKWRYLKKEEEEKLRVYLAERREHE
ncbi:MAG: pseudouridine synthase [Candidatus Caldatribacteriaceae bacterium]